MRLFTSIALYAAVPIVSGDKYDFFSGFFSGTTIAKVQFDDSQNTLTMVNNITIPTSGGSKWIAIDV